VTGSPILPFPPIFRNFYLTFLLLGQKNKIALFKIKKWLIGEFGGGVKMYSKFTG